MIKANYVYLFIGEDEQSKSLSINKLKAKLCITNESLDYHVFYGDDTEAHEILHTLKTPPFTAKYRLVVLKQAEKLSTPGKNIIAEYVKNPSRNSMFVISADYLKRSDKIFTFASKHAKCINFNISEDSFVYKATFKLVDEIGFKKKALAIRTLLSLMQSGKDVHEILGLIGWFIRRLGKVKILLNEGGSEGDIAAGLNINTNRTKKIIDQAKNFTLSEIKRAQQLLIETDRRLKKSISKPEVMIEMLIMRLSSGI